MRVANLDLAGSCYSEILVAIQVGDTIGDYQVIGLLGRGGMGRVYRVRSLLTDREEAMKVVASDLADNPALAERFLHEIKVHARLEHPHIAALRSAQRVGDRMPNVTYF